MQQKAYILTWVYCGKTTQIQQGNIKLLQARKKQLKKQPQYCQGYFEIRTLDGLQNKPILNKK